MNNPLQNLTFGDMANGDSIVYVYGAGGNKLEKLVYENSSLTASTDYAGAYVYKDNLLNFIQSAEGRITKTTSEFVYEYHLKDHIGNVRVAFIDDNGTPKVIQESDHYPFGLKFGEQRIGSDNKYLFSGKEQQDDVVAGVSLDWYDFGARMYSAELGRWHAVDNYAADYHMMSPYTGIGNNPINYYDPDGNRMHEYIRERKKESNYTEDGGAGGGSWDMIDSNGSPTWRASDGIFQGNNVPDVSSGSFNNSYRNTQEMIDRVWDNTPENGIGYNNFITDLEFYFDFNTCPNNNEFDFFASLSKDLYLGDGDPPNSDITNQEFLEANAGELSIWITAGLFLNEMLISEGVTAEVAIGYIAAYTPYFAMALLLQGDTRNAAIDETESITIDISNGENIKIALSDNKFLFDFATFVQGIPWTAWGEFTPSEITPEAFRAALIALGTNPSVEFHFNLTSRNGSLVSDPINLSVNKNSILTMEFITTSGMYSYKTTYWIKSSTIYKNTLNL